MSDFRSMLDNDYKTILTGEFSESFSISGTEGTSPSPVSGIWDETYQTVDPNTGAAVMSTKPRLTVFVADVPFEIKQGHIVTRAKTGKEYRVKTPETDGEGSVTLYF